MKKLFGIGTWLAAATMGLLASAPAAAQGTYPAPGRPVKLIVSQQAGGSSDTIARLWAESAAKALGGPVVVENKPGAGGIIAAQQVLSQPADGYTLLFAGVSQMVLNKFVYKPLPYEPEKDFTGIGMLTTVPFVLVASPQAGIKTFEALVAQAKAKPGAINFGSAGNGNSTQLVVELLQKKVGIQMTHVPFRGEPDGLMATVAGTVQVMAPVVSTALPQIKAGKVLPLVVLAPQRLPDLPSVPTASELGLQGFDYLGWSGVAAKAGTPPDAVARLHAATQAFHNDPAVKEKLKTLQVIAMQGPASQLMETTQRDTAKWHDAISELNLSAK